MNALALITHRAKLLSSSRFSHYSLFFSIPPLFLSPSTCHLAAFSIQFILSKLNNNAVTAAPLGYSKGGHREGWGGV